MTPAQLVLRRLEAAQGFIDRMHCLFGRVPARFGGATTARMRARRGRAVEGLACTVWRRLGGLSDHHDDDVFPDGERGKMRRRL